MGYATVTSANCVCAKVFAPLAMAVAVLAAHVADAATVSVHTERRGDTIDVEASALLESDKATAWRVLTDYGRYPDFIPDLQMSHVVARRGATVTVEQSGDALLWELRFPLHVTFEITESPPDRLQSHAVAGNLRAFASSYALVPAGTRVRLDYRGHIAPGFEILGQVEEATVQRNIARQFQALADEIERNSAARSTHERAGMR